MRLFIYLALIAAILHCSFAPPVTPDKRKEEDKDENDSAQYPGYHRYLKEVVQALESDSQFIDRLERASEEDVRSGKIAQDLDFVHHNIRTQLDEIKRREIERLQYLATKEYELRKELDMPVHIPPDYSNLYSQHLDHKNPHTFEVEDLKKLIQKATEDLEAVDKKRREHFKEYEMQKEFEKQHKIEQMDESHKKEYMETLKKEDEAKKHHEPLLHPVSKRQVLNVWKTSDKMDEKDFDPKVFFVVHDVDGNGAWDPDEVKALFIKELDKMYGPEGPNKDLHERAEEMERMREHFFKENDRNHDGLIEYSEFMAETQKEDFNQDEGWKPIDEDQIYTQAEYESYEKKRLETIHYLQQRGLIDPHGRPVPGSEHQIDQAIQEFQHMQQQAYGQYQHHPPGQAPTPGEYHGQIPQGQYQGQVPHEQYQGQMPPGSYQGQYQGQVPQGQGPQGQVPQGQIPQGQVPQGQIPQGQVPQGQVPQGQVPQGQVPQGQVSQGQVPQSHVPQGQVPQRQVPQGQIPQAQSPQAQLQQAQVPQGQYQSQVPQGQPSQGQVPPVQQGQAQNQIPANH